MRRFPLFCLLLLISLVGQACTPASGGQYVPQPVSLDDLLTEIDMREGEVVVVNFWATWCLPCRVEFPELVRFGKDFEGKGVDLVFVSTDFENDVPLAAEFLKEQEVPWVSYVKTGRDNSFIEAFHQQWSGALPATFVYDRDGNLRAFWEGITSYEELERTVTGIL